MVRLRQLIRRIDPGFLVVLAICLVALWPFIGRTSLPQETDAELHIFRLAELSHLIRRGEIYPRWAPNFYHGYGYPIFNYYAPLTYYLGLIVDLMPRLGPVEGVKAIFVLGILLAAAGMYGFVRDNWGRPAGYVAAAVYIYAPYIQYIDPHARGVLPESFSFGAFALALWMLDRLRREVTAVHWMAAVLAVTAVILSHNLMALLFFSLLLAWAVWRASSYKLHVTSYKSYVVTYNSKPVTYLLPLAALFLGLGLAAFFWLPVIAERHAVNLNTLIGKGDNYDFHTHFLSWSELLAISPRLDWGDSSPAFHFNLGVAQWLLGGLGVVLLLARRVKQGTHLAFFALALAVLLFLMTPASTSVWEALPFMPYFQFPWRLLGAAAAMLAVLAGAGTAALQLILGGLRWANWLAVTFVALPILLGLPLSQPPPWPDFGPVTMARMSDIELRGRWLGTTSTADYVPVTVDMIPSRNGDVVRGLYEGYEPDRVNRATLPQGATVHAETIRPLKTRYIVSSAESFYLRLFLFDFPGWSVRIDGQTVQTELGRPEGFIVIPVPAGDHVVDVQFGSTPVRTVATALSSLSLGLMLLSAWYLPRTIRQSGEPEGDVALTRADKRTLLVVLAITAVHLLLLQPAGWLHHASTGYTAATADVHTFADFGGQIALIGYDVSTMQAAPDDTVKVVLYWKAQEPLEINYQSFLHVLAADGFLVAQSDHLNPGDFPTRRWSADKYVRDEHYLTLPPNLPPGDYAVTTGLWVQAEGWRLPVLDGEGGQTGDHATLFHLKVKGP